MAKPKIYISHAYLFSLSEREALIVKYKTELEKLGLEIIEPYENDRDILQIMQPGWAYQVGQRDIDTVINQCHAVFVILNGTALDSGVCVELGAAIAAKKINGKPEIFLFRDDVRKIGAAEEYPLNLMLFSGHDKDNWQDYYYENIEEITSPNKALYKWAEAENKELNKLDSNSGITKASMFKPI